MLPASDVNLSSEKKTDFGVTACIYKQRQLCRILRRAALVVGGGEDEGGWGGCFGVTMLTIYEVGNIR